MLTSYTIMNFKSLFLLTIMGCSAAYLQAQSVRSVERLDTGWKFAFGNASQPSKDFGRGTEYFNYLTKSASIHNEGPYTMKFDDSSWKEVRIPHDWVTQLPYERQASHSHGYRTVGWKYPETSVGWYRRTFKVPATDKGKRYELQFDGIFRAAEIWVNGVFMGGEPSGYATQVFDITDYLLYDADNLITVRADASLEEGWFYEGAGIYRDAWLRKTNMVHVRQFGTFVHSQLSDNYTKAQLTIETEVENSELASSDAEVVQVLIDATGKEVAKTAPASITLLSKEAKTVQQTLIVQDPHLWDTKNPYMYEVKTIVSVNGEEVDTYTTPVGIREAKFDNKWGFVLNGKKVTLRGVNMHQDHAGVGSAIPDALQAWRIKQLKAIGCNAYRASHNPMTPAMLDICDREGILVIDENRLVGTSPYQLHQLELMIKRDRNHPSVVLWSDGNEEWGLENTEMGMRIAASMAEHTHRLDPTRQVCIANAGGNVMIQGLEVIGYNYIKQNDIDGQISRRHETIAVGTEETTGCGTRGIYYTDEKAGHMASINRTDKEYENVIERGWKFYFDHPNLGGLFFWTGFDYKGEPNPLSYPAVSSEFGILDYCGFPKDEAYYLKSVWTGETVLHLLPHWNLAGHEGENVSVWAYSNCDEVELYVNGKSLGRKAMPLNGHLAWDAVYQPGKLRAVGYKNGKKVKETIVETTGEPTQLLLSADRTQLVADNRDLAVMTIALKDKKGRVVPTACNTVTIKVSGNARILGAGNGDPAFRGEEHPASDKCQEFTIPAFNGYAQVLVQTTNTPGTVTVTCEAEGCKRGACELKIEN